MTYPLTALGYTVAVLERIDMETGVMSVIGVYENPASAMESPDLPAGLSWYNNGLLKIEPIPNPLNPSEMFQIQTHEVH